jgi:hypothetical protein
MNTRLISWWIHGSGMLALIGCGLVVVPSTLLRAKQSEAAPPNKGGSLESRVDKAIEDFNGDVASIIATLKKEIEERLTEALDRGDLDAARDLQAAQEALVQEGVLPKEKGFARALESAGRTYAVASAKVSAVYEDVVREYTKLRNLQRAELVSSEAQALQRIEPLKAGVLKPQDRKSLQALAARPKDLGIQPKNPPLAGNAQEPRLALRHQGEEPGLCSVTCGSIVLDYFGTQVPPRALKVMSRGRNYNPNEPFNDFTGTMFRDLCAAVGRLGYTWTRQQFANDANGFAIGLQQIKAAIDAGKPVIIDLTNAFGQDGSHVFIVCGYSDRTSTAYILDPHAQAPGIRELGYAQLALTWNSLGIRGAPFNGRGMVVTAGK